MGLIPWMSDKNLYCGIYLPDDGHLDPHGATLAVAKAATSLGAAVFTNTRVKGIQLSRKGEIAQAIFVRSEISKSSK